MFAGDYGATRKLPACLYSSCDALLHFGYSHSSLWMAIKWGKNANAFIISTFISMFGLLPLKWYA